MRSPKTGQPGCPLTILAKPNSSTFTEDCNATFLEIGNIQNDLLCAQGDLESTKPTKELIKLSNWILSHPTIKKYILDHNEDELTNELIYQSPGPQLLDLAKKLKEYIEVYGFRCVNELKLEVD